MTDLTPERIQAEAQLRMKRALDLIQQAQHDLVTACGELSALQGAIPIWRSSHKMTDQVRALWYRVDAVRKRGKFKLDETNIEYLRRRLTATGNTTVLTQGKTTE